ncbi:MBL fold metallo-hydrolase [Dethiosulfovibrio sp. F2B]|uniref:MBL fold metallo-hydrolase n=1 Tax=Dethiosulfovibrio faecalis TaxID=2720018 RepID=UPI001F19B8FF|nr:MBL fold metallo-hydrolase [Dethiosulfovibrio faecalis]MCF4150847.1 MBL fold metallo-hydrolase [Dethiosulfovibrio faecalis]
MLPVNGLVFLGTAGTRFNVINQRRSSGGMVASLDGFILAIDPGPGALVRMCSLRPTVDPNKIDGMLLTHRHIDHSGDFNVVAEAMTGGGRRPGGLVALPSDAISEEPVLFGYLKRRIAEIHLWKDCIPVPFPKGEVLPLRLRHHGVECYGLKFIGDFPTWGIISDTAYIAEIPDFFSDCDVVVANTTLLEKVGRIEHLSVLDVEKLLEKISPKLLLMTHLGTRILDSSPSKIAAELSNERTQVLSAEDGMIIDFDEIVRHKTDGKTYREE